LEGEVNALRRFHDDAGVNLFGGSRRHGGGTAAAVQGASIEEKRERGFAGRESHKVGELAREKAGKQGGLELLD
jgi:hypothetical protein